VKTGTGKKIGFPEHCALESWFLLGITIRIFGLVSDFSLERIIQQQLPLKLIGMIQSRTVIEFQVRGYKIIMDECI
jgi:hypothetical protein